MELCDPSLVPPKAPGAPGSWSYVQPESGLRLTGGSRADLMRKVLEHRRSNGYPVGTHYEQEVEHSLCLALSDPQRAEFCCEPRLPDLVSQALSFGRSASRTIAAVALGQGPGVAEEILKARKDTCAGCEFLRARDQRCSKCGCFIAVKTWLRAEKCPIGKW